MKLTLILACLLAAMCVLPTGAKGAEIIPLKLTQKNIHDAVLHELADGEYEITTTVTDPYVFTELLAQQITPEQHMLSFEYFSATGTNHVQIYVMPPLDEAHSVMSQGLNARCGERGGADSLCRRARLSGKPLLPAGQPLWPHSPLDSAQ